VSKLNPDAVKCFEAMTGCRHHPVSIPPPYDDAWRLVASAFRLYAEAPVRGPRRDLAADVAAGTYGATWEPWDVLLRAAYDLTNPEPEPEPAAPAKTRRR
jgi:hypothetical protein